MLIERGADLTTRNNHGLTPLLQEGQVDVARMLIERGADVTTQCKDGETPLHLTSAPSSLWVSLQECVEVVHMLLERGADVNAQNKNGSIPSVLALQGGFSEITLMYGTM